MLMVILGAGASHDSVAHWPVGSSPLEAIRPPLTKNLFQDRAHLGNAVARYDQMSGVVSRLRHLGDLSLESVLDELISEAKVYSPRAQQLAAVRFYIRAVIDGCAQRWWHEAKGITNHATLVDRLAFWQARSREEIIFVTFNYDLLLESACRDVLGMRLESMDAYIAQQSLAIFKPHGSVNWVRGVSERLVAGQDVERQLIARAPELTLEGFSLRHGIGSGTPAEPLFPALAIPVQQKEASEMPASHRRRLIDLVPHVTRLLVVGWRATEEHFLELLRESRFSPEFGLIVSSTRSGAECTAVRLRSAGAPACAIADYGFTRMFQEAELGRLLQPG